MRKALFVLLGLVFVALAAALAAPWLVDAAAYRGEIADRVSIALGRPVAIAGPVAIAVLPTPRLRASDVRIDAAPDDARASIEARHVDVEIGWGSLFGGPIELTHLRLVEPTLLLDAAGEKPAGWAMLDAAETGALRIERLEIEGGRVVWRRADGPSRTVEQIQAVVAAPAIGAVRAAGTAVAGGVPLDFDLALGDAPPRRPRAVSASVTLRPGLARATFRGTYARPESAGAPELRGRVHLEGGSLAAALAAVAPGWRPDGWTEAALAPDFAADAELHAIGDSLSGTELAVRVGELRATGAVGARIARTPVLDLSLAMTWLDLDRLAQAPRPRAAAARAERRSAGGVVAPLVRPEAADRLGMPTNLDGSLELAIEALGVNGGVIRQVRLSAVLSRGDVVVNQATLQLPGGAALTASGQIARDGEGARVEGALALDADNLRGLLTWLGVDASAVPADRLRRFSGRANVGGTLRALALTDMDLRFDSSRMSGGIAIVPAARPGLGIDLRLDQLNIDAYHGAAPAAPPPRAGGAAVVLSASLLDAFDATVRLRADALAVGGVSMTGAAVDGVLHGGHFDVRELAVADILGARAAATGRIVDVARDPIATLDVNVQAADGSRLLRLIDFAPAPADPSLSLTGTVAARSDEIVAIDNVRLRSGGAELSGRARYEIGPRRLSLDLAAETLALEALPTPLPASGVNLDLELALAAKRIGAGGPALEGVRLDARLEGGAIAAATLKGSAFGGDVTLTARAADAAGLTGSLGLSGIDLRQALAALAGTEAVDGRIDLRAALASPSRAVGELRGRLSGTVELAGQGGTIAGVDLAAMQALLRQGVPVDIVSLLGAGLKGGTTRFTALNGTATIEDGVLSTDNLRIATETGPAAIRGTLDLNRQTLDAVLSLPVDAAAEVPPLRIALRGGVDDPHVAVDFAALQKYLLNRRSDARP